MRLPSFIVLMITLLACYFSYITGVAKLAEAGIAFFIVFFGNFVRRDLCEIGG